jgi:hypothetical protein
MSRPAGLRAGTFNSMNVHKPRCGYQEHEWPLYSVRGTRCGRGAFDGRKL